MHCSDESAKCVDKSTLVCIVLMCLCLLSSILLFGFSRGKAGMVIAGDVLIDIGLALFSMLVYFKKDSNKKRIIKSVIFLLTVSCISVVFKEFFSKYGMFAVAILFQAVGLMINIVDNLIRKVSNR